MQTIKTTNKIHPLMAGAAASVMLVSLVGVAAIAGLLPNSRGEAAQLAAAPAKPAVEHVVASGQEEAKPAPKAAQKHVAHQPAPVRPVYVQQASAPYHVESGSYSQPQPASQQPVYQQSAYQQPQAQPAARVSPIGIAAGAVVGGVLGNQVGGGNGKTLATVAGAIGGGYLGNEVGKRYGY
jgi:hypothetical protein